MPAPPGISIVNFTDGKIKRGRNKRITSQPSTGWLQGGAPGYIMPQYTNPQDQNAELARRNYWVIIHAKSGTICWTGKLTNVRDDRTEGAEWSFQVNNTLNNSPDDPGSGDETVTVTVINPDTGPSNPAPFTANVEGIP